jgi:hypothetical protein
MRRDVQRRVVKHNGVTNLTVFVLAVYPGPTTAASHFSAAATPLRFLRLDAGFGRRCHLARVAALLASSVDFLQGTFEKIHFHGLLSQQSLELLNFPMGNSMRVTEMLVPQYVTSLSFNFRCP